jgi:2-hydroxy-6-oxonona-2,4-dienedioate hydrolase
MNANLRGAPVLESRWDEVSGVRVHAHAGGEGPSVVLVHGYGVSGRYMLPLAGILASSCTAFAPDLPGHGQSEAAATPLGIGDLAEALGDWLDAVGLERPALVANSMGCQIVTELAVRQPERVGPMVLVGPTIDPARRSARHQIFGALRDSAHEPALLVALAGREWAGGNLGRLRTLARSVLADRIEERLPSIKQPTIVVHGEKDGLISREWAEQAAALLPRGRLVIVRGEPHAIPFTHPRLLAGIVQELIAEEAEYAGRELTRRLPHRDVPARQTHQLRPWQQPLPLLRDVRRHQPVTVSPDQ